MKGDYTTHFCNFILYSNFWQTHWNFKKNSYTKNELHREDNHDGDVDFSTKITTFEKITKTCFLSFFLRSELQKNQNYKNYFYVDFLQKNMHLDVAFSYFCEFADFFSFLPNQAKMSLLHNFWIFDFIWHEIKNKSAKTGKNEKMQYLYGCLSK